MIGTPLMFGDAERKALRALRELAAKCPVDMPTLVQRIKTREGKRSHMDQMNAQTVTIPMGFLVTFSIENGQPAGPCRHMSMSSPAKGRAPSLEAVWMIAEELGFSGGLAACLVYPEELQRGETREVAINLVQPVSVVRLDNASSQ